MKTAYTILSFVGNLKTDDDKVRFSVEPSNGGGIEGTFDTLAEAAEFVVTKNGYIQVVL